MKKLLAVLLSFIMILCCACGAKDDKKEETPPAKTETKKEEKKEEEKKEETPKPADSFEVDKEIYNGQGIIVVCKQITKKGILFELTNQTQREIDFIFWITLDGIYSEMAGDGINDTVPAGETVEIPYYFYEKKEYAEHKTLSMHGEGYVDSAGYLAFDVVDFDLGGESHPEEISSGQPMFSDDTVDAQFIEMYAQGISFRFDNKSETATNVFINSITLNGDTDGGGQAFTIPPHTAGIFNYDVTMFVAGMNGDSISSFDSEFQHQDYYGNNIKQYTVHYADGSITQ